MAPPKKKVIVFDTCVWIELIDSQPTVVDKLIKLASLGVITIGVPDTVRRELRPSGEVAAGQKKNWESRIGELRRCAELLTANQRIEFIGGTTKSPQNFERTLDDMLRAILAYKGNPYRDRVLRLFDSKAVVSIPYRKVLNDKILKFALEKKRPFGERNGAADAQLLFSVSHWASRNSNTEVQFYTFNKRDFSDPTNSNLPHADITHLFSPATNITFHGQLTELHKHIAGLDPVDFEPESSPDECGICSQQVPIETMYCKSCGYMYDDSVAFENYRIKAHRGGYLIDEGAERLSCKSCKRMTFEVEFASFCSYHENNMSNDD